MKPDRVPEVGMYWLAGLLLALESDELAVGCTITDGRPPVEAGLFGPFVPDRTASVSLEPKPDAELESATELDPEVGSTTVVGMAPVDATPELNPADWLLL